MGNSQSELESTLIKDYSNVQTLKFVPDSQMLRKILKGLYMRKLTAGERGYGIHEEQDVLPAGCKAECEFVFEDKLRRGLTSLCFSEKRYHVITGDFLYTRGEMLNLNNDKAREYFTKNRNFIYRYPVENPEDILESMRSSNPDSTNDSYRTKIGISFVKNLYEKFDGGSLLHLNLNSNKTCGLFFNVAVGNKLYGSKQNMFGDSCNKLKEGKILLLDVSGEEDYYVLVKSQRGDFFCCVKLAIIQEVFKEKMERDFEVLSAHEDFIQTYDIEIDQIDSPFLSYGRKKSSRKKGRRKAKPSPKGKPMPKGKPKATKKRKNKKRKTK